MKAMIQIHPKGLVSMFQLPRSTALMVLFGLGVLSGACQSQTKPVELSIKMVNVPAGSFMMADRACKLREVPCSETQKIAGQESCTELQCGGTDNQFSRYEVTISQPFLMSSTEITQADYLAVLGVNPSAVNQEKLRGLSSMQYPVDSVSWYDAVAFANKLSLLENFTPCYSETPPVQWNKACTGYRLPTEAEWEYAARAGENWLYAGSNNPHEVAWFIETAAIHTFPVMQKKPNAWGLYDMSGNVDEWVWDSSLLKGYLQKNTRDPTGPKRDHPRVVQLGDHRVLRGGCYVSRATSLNVSNRSSFGPTVQSKFVGFRVVRAQGND